MRTVQNTPGVYSTVSLSHYCSPVQAGKRRDSFRVSWSLVRAWVFRGEQHSSTAAAMLSPALENSAINSLWPQTCKVRTLSYLFWIIQVSLKSFCLFVLIVCCSSHISQYTTRWICIQTTTQSSDFSVGDKNLGGHRTPLLWRILYIILICRVWKKERIKLISNMAKAIIESVKLPQGGVKLNRQQKDINSV